MLQFRQSIDQIAGPMLDAMPHAVFLVDEDVAIVGLNKSALQMVGESPEVILRRRAGDILHCIHSIETEGGCGRSAFCKDCIVRNSVNKAFAYDIVIKEKVKMEIITHDGAAEMNLSIIAAPFEHEGRKFVFLQLGNVNEFIDFPKIIPMCSACKRIRSSDDDWQKLERYFNAQLALNFTHSICPECSRKLYPELSTQDDSKDKER